MKAWTPRAWGVGLDAGIVVDVAAEYGMTGEGLQAAINAAVSASTGVRRALYLADGVWPVTAELSIPVGARPIEIVGTPHNYGSGGTILRATAAMRSPLAIVSAYHRLRYLQIDGAGLADSASYIDNWTFGAAEWCRWTGGIFDGAYLGQAGINDSIELRQCFFDANGKTYASASLAAQYNVPIVPITGTATITAGSPTITIALGPANLAATTSARAGDWIRVGATPATAFIGQLLSVGADTATLQPAAFNLPTAAQAGAGLPYAIGVGDGWHDTRQANNNVNVFNTCMFRGNGGVGIAARGLFGHTILGGQADFNAFYGVAIGLATNSDDVNGTRISHLFTEGNCASATGPQRDYWFAGARQVLIDNMTDPRGWEGEALGYSRSEYVEDLYLGVNHNFLLEVKNDGGTIKHRIVAEHFDGAASLEAHRIVGASPAFAVTPTVSAGVGFTAGAGILGVATHAIDLNTVKVQRDALSARAWIEYNDTGTTYRALASVDNVNVNGTTQQRVGLYLLDENGAVQKAWSTANIPNGKTIGVRVVGLIR